MLTLRGACARAMLTVTTAVRPLVTALLLERVCSAAAAADAGEGTNDEAGAWASIMFESAPDRRAARTPLRAQEVALASRTEALALAMLQVGPRLRRGVGVSAWLAHGCRNWAMQRCPQSLPSALLDT